MTINHIGYLNDDKNKDFDWKTFYTSLIFFFVALVNIRDFPIPNVPLIYPAFLIYFICIGPEKLFESYRRTKLLCLLLIIYWCYQKSILLIKGGKITLYELGIFLEPLLIFCAAGMATIRPGGTKAAIWALIFAITLSTAGGIWIYFIGEPLASLVRTLHSQIGGNFLQGEILGSANITADLVSAVKRNSGLTSRVFGFAYQLAIATVLVIMTFLSRKRTLSITNVTLIGIFIILFIGIITSAERGPILSVSAGLLFFFFIDREKMLNLGTVTGFILSILVVVTVFHYSSKWEDKYTIHKRTAEEGRTYVRAVVMPTAAMETIFTEPLGAGVLSKDLATSHWRMSDNYIRVAYENGWLNPFGPKSPHNHFANIIMYTGIVGIFLALSLFWGLWKKIRKMQYLRASVNIEEFVLPFACITAIVHSFFQNAGFYMGEPATQIAFGLLWGTSARIKYPRFNHLIKKWVID